MALTRKDEYTRSLFNTFVATCKTFIGTSFS